jgi:hypothetical protein
MPNLKSLSKIFIICVAGCVVCLYGQAQQVQRESTGIFEIPGRFLSKLDAKVSGLEKRVIRETEKSLMRLSQQEQKLRKRLMKKDSVAAKKLFADSEKQYRALIRKMREADFPAIEGKIYEAYLDTLATSLKFLDNNFKSKLKANNLNANNELITGTHNKLKNLDSKLDYTQYVRDYLKQRQDLLKRQFQRFGMTKSLLKYNKQAYYYSQQINEYKSILNDPTQLERKVISALQKLTVFQEFMQKYSGFAAMFPVPSNSGIAMTSGLQTREQVSKIIQSQVGMSGPAADQFMQQQLQRAEAALGSMKERLENKLSNGESEVPDFKPNNQKTKKFLSRLELGTNLQTVKSNEFFPSTTDVGISLGYKLNENGIAGLGASYKMGWGKDISHIRISHEGIGLRTFIDWKLRGSFYISGGYEQNYRSSFKTFSDLYGISQWQQSGLVGISKIMSLKTKLFKKTKAQLLWDFLSYQQLPREQPLKFRLGYNF